MQTLLIIDDSLPFLKDVEILLSSRYKILKAENGKKGLSILSKENVSAVLLDLQLPDINGIDILKQIHTELDPFLPVLIITDYGNVENAVLAMQSGAYDFIQKDFNRELLFHKISKALERRELDLGIKTLKDSVSGQYDFFVCSSKPIKRLDNEISKVARQNVDVLISGETGAGKDVIANEIYKRSSRKDKLFVQVSLNSLSDTLIESELFGYEKGAFSGADTTKIGKFEAANGGTIYLPEISEISEKIQLKLLYFMQYKEITKVGQGSVKKINLDVRIIMATNRDLKQLVSGGKMRQDFYYRINVINLSIPPLRERKDGIEDLANYFLNLFLRKHNKQELSFDKVLMEAMINAEWKGNIRELKNSIERAVVMADNNTVLTLEDFPDLNYFEESVTENNRTFQSAMNKSKREYFLSLLAETKNNKTKASEIAGLSRQGLIKILKELKIE